MAGLSTAFSAERKLLLKDGKTIETTSVHGPLSYAYVVDMKRLLQLSGYKQHDDSNAVVVEQAIAGLPPEYAIQLWMTLAGKTLMISG